MAIINWLSEVYLGLGYIGALTIFYPIPPSKGSRIVPSGARDRLANRQPVFVCPRGDAAAGAGPRPSADTGPGACTPMGEIGLNCLSRSTKAAGYRHSECKHLSGKILSRRAASKTALKNELRQRFVFQI